MAASPDVAPLQGNVVGEGLREGFEVRVHGLARLEDGPRRMRLVPGGVARVRRLEHRRRQHVGAVVGEHQEEGPLLRLCTEEVHGPPRPQVGHVLARVGDVERAAVVDDHLVDEALGVTAAEGRPELEAELRLLVGAEVVLADQRRRVPRIGQGLRQVAEFLDRRIVGHGVMLRQPVVHARARWNESREKRGAGG